MNFASKETTTMGACCAPCGRTREIAPIQRTLGGVVMGDASSPVSVGCSTATYVYSGIAGAVAGGIIGGIVGALVGDTGARAKPAAIGATIGGIASAALSVGGLAAFCSAASAAINATGATDTNP